MLSGRILRLLERLLRVVVFAALALAGTFSAYALWDNRQVYAAAETVQADMLRLKPPETGADGGASFEELLAVNGDVRAWLTLDGTNIDYPVLQGADNLAYINRDVYGSFALAGSIFLDAAADAQFSDPYSVLYGHHMEEHRMFGDLDLYKDAAFFRSSRTGALLLPERSYRLEIFAVLTVPASEERIFHAALWQNDIAGLLDYARENALHFSPDTANALPPDGRVLALTTCSSEFTNARTVVLAAVLSGESGSSGG